jgi:Protein of unknown function (DUF2750)
MQLTDRQAAEIYAKKPESRYRYFVKSVMEEEEVWGLAQEEGWLMFEDADEQTDIMPVFPAAAFAEIFRSQTEYSDCKVEALDLYEFMDWLEDFEAENVQVAIFPSPDLHTVVLPANRLKADLQREFDKENGEAEE